METHELIPEVIDVAPKNTIQVSYPSGVKVDLGNELTPTQVKDQPKAQWEADNNSLYTLLMIDPDAPSRTPPKVTVLHWFVGNIPGNDVQKGQEIAAYRGSGPPEGTGLHRYIFLVYKQNGNIAFEEKPILKTSREGRMGFDLRKFTEKYNLGNPVAGNLYQAQYDDYVPIMWAATK